MKYIIENNSVKIEEKTKNESGQFTGQKHFRSIGPEADISEETEYVQGLVKSARAGYVKPVVADEQK
jgi:hypothetical protein